MKKKLIQILMLSVVAVSVGSFVSCKDTNEDLYNELNTQTAQALAAQNATLDQAIAEWANALNEQKDLYQQLLDKIGKKGLDGKIDSLYIVVNHQLDSITNVITKLEQLKVTKADKSTVDSLTRVINDLTRRVEANEKILKGWDALTGQVRADSAAIKELETSVAKLNTLSNGLKDSCDNFSVALQKLVHLPDSMKLIHGQVMEALSRIKAVEVLADTANAKADRALRLYADLNSRLSSIGSIVNDSKRGIDAIWTKLNDLDEAYNVLKGEVKNAMDTARAAFIQAEANENEINDLKLDVQKLKSNDSEQDRRLGNLEDKVNKLNDAISTLKDDCDTKFGDINLDITNLKNAIDNLEKAGERANKAIEDLSDRICCLETQVGLLEGSLAVATAASITHYEMAKKYADEQVRLLELRLQSYVQDYVARELAEFLANHPDVDLSKYVTRDELTTRLQNYATQAELTTALSGINTRLGQLSNDMLTIQAALQTAINNLTNDVLQHGISINDLKNQLAALDSKLNNLDSKVNGIDSKVTKNTVDIEWIKSLLTTLNDQVADLNANSSKYISRDEFNEWLKLMEKAIEEGGNHNNEGNNYDVDLTLPSIVVQTICNKIAEDLDDKVSEKLAELLSDKDFLDSFGKSLVDALGLLTADDLKALKYMTEDDVKALLEPIKALAEANQKDIEDHEDRIKDLENKIQGLADLIIDDKVIDALKTIFATKDDIKDFLTEDQIKALLDDYVPTNIINQYLTNNDYITRTDATNIINNFLKEYYTKTEIDNELKNYITNDYLTKNFYTKTDVLDLISTSEGKVKDLSDAVKGITDQLPEMKKDISDLKDAVKENKDLIDKLNTEVEKLKGDVKAIQEELAKQVTSIIIQGTYCPMFGSFNLPANIQSNILLSYYGIPMSDGKFPTYKTGSYTKPEQAFTSEEINALVNQGLDPFEFFASEPLLNENGTGGKVYMTINPNTADLDGLQMSIVNTLDEEAPVRLRPIKKSEAKLQFGFTRANNGFYEAEAYIEPDDVKTKNNGVPLTREEIENAFKSIKDRLVEVGKDYETKGGTNLGQLATDVYQVIRGLKMDRHGLKCTYTANGEEHSVYSEYNMAATFFNPLNLNTAKDFHFVTMPGYEAVDALLNKISKTIKDKVSTVFKDINGSELIKKIQNFEIKQVELADLSDELIAKFRITIGDDVSIDGMTYHMELPVNAEVPVMFADNLKVNGTRVNVPADRAVKDGGIAENITNMALVVCGNVTATSVPLKVVVAVRNDSETKYVWYKLGDDQIKDCRLDETGTTPRIVIKDVMVAGVSGSNELITAGYSPSIQLDDDVIEINSTQVPSLKLEFTYDLQNEMVEIWGKAQDAIGNVNDMLKDLQDIVDSLNDALKNINSYEGKIDNMVDEFINDYLRKYLDKINGSVVGFVNSMNRRFGPFMVASNDSKGFKRLSGSKEYPTIMNKDNLKFYPTTKSLELIVPLARKHVAVTNVFKGTATAYDNADCLAKMKAVNSGADLNKVIDGTVRKVNVTGMEAGYVYEVAYSVLDFDGNMSTSRYYIQVK